MQCRIDYDSNNSHYCLSLVLLPHIDLFHWLYYLENILPVLNKKNSLTSQIFEYQKHSNLLNYSAVFLAFLMAMVAWRPD